MTEPRFLAAALLLLPLATILLFARLLAQRSHKPAAIWIAAGYWALVHLICLYSLLTSTRFETGFAQLALFTFPASALTADTLLMQGFATLPDLAVNYVRFVIVGGGFNTVMIAGFLQLVVPDRPPLLPSRTL